MLQLINVNIASVFVATIAAYLFGWLWHGPLFGKTWLKLSGMKMPKKITSQVKKQMIKSMSLGFVVTLFSAFFIGYILQLVGATTFSKGLCTAIVLWLAFSLPLMLAGYLWEMKSLKLCLFNAVYRLLELIIIAGIIAAW